MARKQLHGLRHGQQLEVKGIKLKVDTKSDDAWVVLTRTGTAEIDGVTTVTDVPVVRAAKESSGTFFPQGTNPTPGRPGYPIETYRNGTWHEYSDSAEAGYVRRHLARFV